MWSSSFESGLIDALNYQGIDEILEQLRKVQAKRHRVHVLVHLAQFVLVIAAVMLAMPMVGCFDGQPPFVLRWGLACGTLIACLISLIRIVQSIFWRQAPEQTARFVESQINTLDNHLINSVLLSGDVQQASPELVQKNIHEALDVTRQANLAASVSPRPAQRWWCAALLGALAVIAAAAAFPRSMQRGLAAVLTPWDYVRHFNQSGHARITPGDTTVLSGQNVNIVASIENPQADQFSARELSLQLAKLKPRILINGQDQPLALLAGDNNSTFTTSLTEVRSPIQYAVVIGDNRWPEDRPWFKINVVESIELEKMALTITPPAYTRLEPIEKSDFDGNISAPQQSKVRLSIKLDQPVAQVSFENRQGELTPMQAAEDGRSYHVDRIVDTDTEYRLVLRDEQGRAMQQFPAHENASSPSVTNGYYKIHARKDLPPQIRFLHPGQDITAAPGQSVRVKLHASDDYPLAWISLHSSPKGTLPEELTRWSISDRKKATVQYELKVPADLPDDGSVVLEYFAQASDTRRIDAQNMGPQTSRSRVFRINVQNAAELSQKASDQYEQIRKKLLEILNLQISERVRTSICWTKHTELSSIHQTAGQIVRGQVDIHKAMTDLLAKHEFTQNLVALQQELRQLTSTETSTAIQQAHILTALAQIDNRNKSCHTLAATQNRIIASLQSMLAIMPELADKPRQQGPQPEDLPQDIADKLRKLQNQLKEFQTAQNKAIEATERLAKTPLDNFQPEDLKSLQELQASQDRWEKFLNEAFTDFSKLAEQDYSNPALLKELLSVKCDVTMVKDALSSGATEIATAAESNSLENAKTLTANIEKWLPGKPDREKWDMESAPEQENTEMPELPSELEDIVGDLLEEEEDLFEEMQDISSSYADSLDKGAGWDAMDGPISNMNAQGVTGNQLPNSNEIQGRSGEGRQGKASGEHVEDKAVGKGGRRTPTRLSHDPFQKGQIDDRSKEPPGGATGGGKLSGAGAEGLEGPVPPELQKQLKRLAGKQAALINKAERIRTRFQPTDHTNLKLFKAITLMNRVQNDLKQNRYTNALRARKQVLSALGDTAMLVSGEVTVQADTSQTMPKHVKEDIADAMNGTLPEEFRQALKQYFKRISQDGQ